MTVGLPEAAQVRGDQLDGRVRQRVGDPPPVVPVTRPAVQGEHRRPVTPPVVGEREVVDGARTVHVRTAFPAATGSSQQFHGRACRPRVPHSISIDAFRRTVRRSDMVGARGCGEKADAVFNRKEERDESWAQS